MTLPQNPMMSPAAMDLGLGGMLQDQVAGETDEQRKRRMAEMQQRQMMGGSAAASMLYPNGYSPGGVGLGNH